MEYEKNKTEKIINPMTNLHKIIAKKMEQSKAVIPHFYMSIEVDVEKLCQKRNSFLEINKRKVGYTPFLIKIIAVALKKYPLLNAQFISGYKIKYNNLINIGVATATKRGLVVPVIKDSYNQSLYELIEDFEEKIERARLGKPTLEDFSGSTFTISNAGIYGIDSFFGIINPPEVAILCIGKIIKKAVVVGENIEIRKRMISTISADHRIVDGEIVAKFLSYFKSIIESEDKLKKILFL